VSRYLGGVFGDTCTTCFCLSSSRRAPRAPIERACPCPGDVCD
jgi:hypothetical protein